MKKEPLLLLLILSVLPFVANAETNILTGGTASTDSQYSDDYSADKAVDGNTTGTRWSTSLSASMPHWWKYDLGNGIAYAPYKLRICTFKDGGKCQIKNFKLQGSHNGSDWQDLYSGTAQNLGYYENSTTWQEFTFYAGTAYRYLRLYVIDAYGDRPDAGMWEIEIFGTAPYQPYGIKPVMF